MAFQVRLILWDPLIYANWVEKTSRRPKLQSHPFQLIRRQWHLACTSCCLSARQNHKPPTSNLEGWISLIMTWESISSSMISRLDSLIIHLHRQPASLCKIKSQLFYTIIIIIIVSLTSGLSLPRVESRFPRSLSLIFAAWLWPIAGKICNSAFIKNSLTMRGLLSVDLIFFPTQTCFRYLGHQMGNEISEFPAPLWLLAKSNYRHSALFRVMSTSFLRVHFGARQQLAFVQRAKPAHHHASLWSHKSRCRFALADTAGKAPGRSRRAAAAAAAIVSSIEVDILSIYALRNILRPSCWSSVQFWVTRKWAPRHTTGSAGSRPSPRNKSNSRQTLALRHPWWIDIHFDRPLDEAAKIITHRSIWNRRFRALKSHTNNSLCSDLQLCLPTIRGGFDSDLLLDRRAIRLKDLWNFFGVAEDWMNCSQGVWETSFVRLFRFLTLPSWLEEAKRS